MKQLRRIGRFSKGLFFVTVTLLFYTYVYGLYSVAREARYKNNRGVTYYMPLMIWNVILLTLTTLLLCWIYF